jgi:hypothetical protein
MTQIGDESTNVVAILSETDKQEIINRLNRAMISSSIPLYVCNEIREVARHGSMQWSHTLPLLESKGLTFEYRFNPDGSLEQQIRDWNGIVIWRGSFR